MTVRPLRWAVLGVPGLLGVLAGARVRAVRRRPQLAQPSYVVDAVVGALDEDPARIVVLGDSMAAGVGAPTIEESLPVLLAERVAKAIGRSVHVLGYGVGGATVATTRTEQVTRMTDRADAVVLVVGGNDILHITPPRRFTADVRSLVRDLRERTDAPIVLTGSPGVRIIPVLRHPLREIAGVYGALLHELQRHVARQEGAVFADLKAQLTRQFRRDRSLFASDEFHPSPAGYAVLANALAPTVVKALRQV